MRSILFDAMRLILLGWTHLGIPATEALFVLGVDS
jgi:hypothetical protein